MYFEILVPSSFNCSYIIVAVILIIGMYLCETLINIGKELINCQLMYVFMGWLDHKMICIFAKDAKEKPCLQLYVHVAHLFTKLEESHRF
jgi:hypothetical protein